MQKILGAMRKAIIDYNMISEGDKIAVGISGGKDSTCLLTALTMYKKFAPNKFDIIAININMGFKDLNMDEVSALIEYCKKLEVPFIIEKTDIAEIISNVRKETNPCSLCANLRRGYLNTIAIKNGCNKIALGHHSDDVLETMMLSFIYEGRIATFKPTTYLDRTKITLIRPFIYVEEKEIRGACKRFSIPILHNPCPADKHTKRQYMKDLIKKIDEDIPSAKEHMVSAINHPERYSLWNKDMKLDDTIKKTKDD
jgi:tRNA(Ile)-lysidine synthetase-like protein